MCLVSLTQSIGPRETSAAAHRSSPSTQQPLGSLSEFLGDLVKAARLEYDLGSCVANHVSREFLAFDDQAGIADAGRDIGIRHLTHNERASFFRCDQIVEIDSTEILNQATSFHAI